MRLLSGSVKLAGLLILLLLLASTLPISWSSSGSQFRPGAAVVWAGSPDETLNPPPEPPKKTRVLDSYGNYVTTESRSITRLEATRTRLSWTQRFGYVWSFYLSKVLRF